MPDQIVEHRGSSSSTAVVLLGVVALVLVAVVAFFLIGGPGRFGGSAGSPSQTNVNVPSQSQPQAAPNIQVPRQIDVNVNQQPAPQAPAPNR